MKQNNQNYYNSHFNVKLWYKIYYFNIIYYDRKYNGWNIQEYHNTFYILTILLFQVKSNPWLFSK